jgi:hypothetical protein
MNIIPHTEEAKTQYFAEVEEKVKFLLTQLKTYDHKAFSKTESKHWNNTRWEVFCKVWSDEPTDAIISVEEQLSGNEYVYFMKYITLHTNANQFTYQIPSGNFQQILKVMREDYARRQF